LRQRLQERRDARLQRREACAEKTGLDQATCVQTQQQMQMEQRTELMESREEKMETMHQTIQTRKEMLRERQEKLRAIRLEIKERRRTHVETEED